MTRLDFIKTESQSNEIKRLSIRGGFVTVSAQVIRFLMQMVSTMILARLLTPADFGLVAMVTVITGFISMFKDAGLSMATVQCQDLTKEQVSTLFWINFWICILLIPLVALLAPVIVWYYNETRLMSITLAMAGTFLFSGLMIQHQALLQRQMKFKELAIIDIVSMAIGITGAVIVALLTRSYWALVVMPITSSAVSTIGMWHFCGWIPGKANFRSGIRSLLSFGGNLTASNVVYYFARSADTFLIGRRYGALELGLYSRAMALLVLPLNQALGPVNSVMIPMLSRFQNMRDEYRRSFLRIYSVIGLLAMPATVFLIIMAEPIIAVVLGPQWGKAALIFQYLSAAAMYMPMATVMNWLFVTQGRTRQMFICSMINSVLTVTSFFVGLPYGPAGVALAFGVSGLVLRFPILVYYAGMEGPVGARDLYANLLIHLPATVMVALTCEVVKIALSDWNPLIQLLSGGVAVAIVLFATIWLIPNRKGEIIDAWRTIRRHLLPDQGIEKIEGTI